ncbi:hypothetical protein MBLNU230_g0085t1 [Neophaeotheca triangularis]
MAGTMSATEARSIVSAGLKISPPPPTTAATPASVSNIQRNERLAIDTFSPVNQNGSFEFDRIIKQGEVLKRTRKTKAWKSIYIVLRPNLLSIYRDSSESKLRHQINLSDLTAVARQKDPKRKSKQVFGLFSPSRNWHLEAPSEAEAQIWVEVIRREARIDEEGNDFTLKSPGGMTESRFQGFERDPGVGELVHEDRGGYSSSDVEAMHYPPPRTRRDRGNKNYSMRRPSHTLTLDYSGAEAGSYSDFSDSAAPATARMSALSLPFTDSGRPSTSSAQNPPNSQHHQPSIYGASPMARPTTITPALARTTSETSNLALENGPSIHDYATQQPQPAPTPSPRPPADPPERVVHQSWLYLLKSKNRIRQWKKVWMVLRPRALALYKNEEEYTALLIVPFETIIDVVEINPISRSKKYCMQVLSEERNYRFCALDEEGLERWLGGFKSLLSKRKNAAAGGGGGGGGNNNGAVAAAAGVVPTTHVEAA